MKPINTDIKILGPICKCGRPKSSCVCVDKMVVTDTTPTRRRLRSEILEPVMNKEQKEFLAYYTCGILDRYPDVNELLKSHGIPKHLVDKMTKAFDLIFEVNQYCHKK